MMLANALALGAGGNRAKGGGVPAVRTVPATSDLSYVVLRDGSAAKVVRLQRGVGGSGGSDLGAAYLGRRITGLGIMTSPNGEPAADTTWITDSVGSSDIVGRTSGGVFFGSYHGDGASGSLVSEAYEVDGEASDPTEAATGAAFSLRNEVSSSDGTNSLTRDLEVATQPDASLLMTLHSISSSGLNLFYFGMGIGSGTGFDEISVKLTDLSDWLTLSLGSVEALAALGMIRAVRLRDTSDGRFLILSSDLPDRANFVQCRVDKEASFSRSKLYLSQFSADAAMGGAVIAISWGQGEAGAGLSPDNLAANANWDAPPWLRTHTTGGTVVDSGTDLTMTWSSGTSNLRTNAEILTAALGSVYALSVDLVSDSGGGVRELYAGSNTNGSNSSPAPAVTTTTPVVGRNILVFTATQNAPNQRFAVRNASTAALATVWRNPAVYEIE